MNKIFKVVWSKTKECYVVVSEVAKNNGGKKKALASVLAGLAMVAATAGTPVQAGGNYGGSAVNITPDAYNGSNTTGRNSVAVGYQNRTNDQDGTIAIGARNTATENSAMALGNGNTASGGAAVAMGAYNQATGRASVAIGNVSMASAEDSIAIGNRANSNPANQDRGSGQYSIAMGRESWARGTDNISIGHNATTDSSGDSIAIGRDSTSNSVNTVTIGAQTKATGGYAVAIGRESEVNANFATAMGYQSKAKGSASIAIGKQNNSNLGDTITMGNSNTANTMGGIAIGKNNIADSSIGDPTTANKENSQIAIGLNNKATSLDTVAIGREAESTKTGAVSLGARTKAKGDYAVALGSASENKTVEAADYAVAVGAMSKATGDRSVAVGGGAEASASRSVAHGYKANASVADGVALGSNSKATVDKGVKGFNPAETRTNKYSGLAGTAQTSTLAAVSVGDGATATRQITGLAAGTNDTDAVNVAQLRSVNLKYAGDTGNGDVLLDDGTLKIKGDDPTFISTSADKNGVTVKAKIGADITNTNGKAVAPTTNGIATTDNVAKAINESGWNVVSSNNGGSVTGTQASKKVSPGDTVTLSAGKNIVLDQTDKQFTYSLNKNVDLTKDGSLTIGDTVINNGGMTITGGPSVTKIGINAGNKKITNVAPGTDDTDAVNVKQLKSAKTEVKGGAGVTVAKTQDATDGHDIYTVSSTGATGNTDPSKVEAGKNTTVTGDGTAATPYKVNVQGDLTEISSITNGNGSGKISFAGDQVVKVEGDNPISLDGKGGYVTGLQNKDWDITNPTVVSGRAATEDQLKKVSDGFNNTVKLAGNTGNTDTQKLSQAGGLSFGVVGANNGQYIKTTASGTDVVADLSDDAKAKLNHTFEVAPGSSNVTVSKDTTDPNKTVYKVAVANTPAAGASSTESVVKKAAATGDTNIADVTVGNGKNSGDPDAQYEVNVSRNAVKDAAREAVTVNNGGNTDNPITVTPTDDAANHNTSYAVTFDGAKAAKVIPLTYKANGTGDKTVTLEKGLDFTNGTNTTAEIGNDGVVKYNLNKDVDLTKNGSLTIGDTKVNNDGLTITGGPSITKTGIDAGNKTITNVAPAVNGTDAVNYDQLKAARTVVTSNDKSVTVNKTTNGDQVTYDLHVNAAAGTASTWNLKSGVASTTEGTHAGDSTQNIADGKSVTMQAGKNLTVKQTNDGAGNTEVAYSLDKNLKDLTSVSTDKVTTKEITLKDPSGPSETVIKKDGDRITYTNDGGNTTKTISTLEDEKHITKGEYDVDANGKVTMTYTDGKGNLVTGETAVIKGIAKNDLSNITDDGKKVITGLGTIVKAGENVNVTEASDATTGQKTYTVNAVTPAVYTKADGTKVVKRPDGTYTTNLDGSAGNDVPASDVIVSFQDAAGNTTGGNSIVNNVGSAIDKTGTATGDTFLTKLDDAATATPNAAVNVKDLKSTSDAIIGKELHIAPTAVKAGSTEAKGGVASGTENVYKYDAATKKVTLTYNDGKGTAVSDTKAVIDFSDLNIPAAGNNYSFKTNATGNLETGTTATETEVASGKTVNFGAGKNLTVTQKIGADGNQTYTYALNKDLTNLDKVVVNGKDGKDGEDGVSITGPTGAAGTDGNNGKVGITGKDGKDAVSISGKDGVGHIGLTGPAGKDGKNATADITVKDGVPGVDGQPGETMTRIVYQDKDGNEHQVATHDDGMKFAGDDGQTDPTKVIKKHLNNVVDIVGGADKTKLTDNNIGVNNDNGKLKVQLAKEVNLGADGSLTTGATKVDNNGVTITAPAGGTTTDVKLTKDGLDNGGNKIVNVKAGENDTDAVNVKQLKDKVTTVASSDNSIKVVDKNDPTSATYDAAKGHQYDITINNQSVVEKAQTPVVYTDKDGNKLYKIVDPATGNVTFNTKEDGSGTTVQPADVIASMNNGGDSTTDPMKLNNVGSSIADKAGNTYLDKINAAANDNKTKNGAVNVTDLKNTADALIDKGLNFDANSGGVKTNKLGSTVKVQGEGAKADTEYSGENVKTIIGQDADGNTTIDVKLDKNLKAETITVTGKDGKDGKIGINGKDGTNGVDGTNRVDIQVEKGVDGIDGKNGADGISRIVYEDKTGKHTVATLEDGLAFKGDNTTVVKKKLGEQLDIVGGADSSKLTDNNIGVNEDNGKLKVQLSKDLDLTENGSVKIGDTNINKDGLTITGGPSVTKNGIDAGNKTITGVKAGENDTDAVNVKQLKDNVTTVTSSDNSISVTDTNTDPAKGHAYDIKINSQGVVNKAQTPVVYTKQDGTKVYLVGDKFYNNPEGTGAEVPKSDVIASMNNADGSTTNPMKLNNVGSSIADKAGNTFLDKIDAAAGDNNTKNGAVNVTDLKNTADALIDKGLNFDANSGGVKTNKLGSTVKVQGEGAKADTEYSGENVKTIIGQDADGNTTIDVKLDKNLKAETITVTGKDGKDGKIGINGKDGTNGVDGTNRVDIQVEKGVDGIDGKNGADGISRIVYEDKTGKHTVATLEDGLAFKGDNTTVVKKKLGEQLDIVGGADSTKLTDNNIGVNEDGGKLKVQLSKDLDLTKDGSVKIGDTTVNNDGLTIAGGPSVTKTGIDAGNKTITGVKAGENDTDAVNVKQLKDKVTTVESSDNTISVTDKNDPTSATYDAAKGHQYDIKINNQGVVNNAQLPVVYTKQDGTKVYKQPDGTFNTAKDGSGTVVAPNEVIASMNSAGDSTTAPTKLNNVGSSIADKAGNTFLDKIDAAAADNNTKNGAVNVTDLKNAADAIGNKGLNFGTQSTGANSEIHKNLGEKLEIVGEGTKADDNYSASNIKTMTKDGKVVIGLDKDLNGLNSIGVPGKDGVAGKDGVSISGKDGANGIDGKVSIGKDGKDAVSIAGKDGVGHIGLTGPQGPAGADGTGVDISTDHGSKTLVKPEANNGDKSERIVYVPKDKDGNPLKDTDGNPIKREVATMDDGLKFTGNNTGTENKHALNTLVKVQGEGVTAAESTAFQSAAGNINVVADGNDTLTVKLNKDLKGISSIKNSDNGPALNFNAGDLSVTGGNLNMGGNKITNLGKGTNDTDAVNLKQLKDSRTIVKSTDGSVGVRESESADGAKVYDLSTGASPRFDELTDEIGRVGAQGAALAALKPIQYDPLEPTQIMAGYGNYRGNSAIAMGVAHYKNESTMMHAGLAWAGGSRHMMANAGVTWKVGNRDSEAAVADRYRKGPISSAYAMQQEMASVKAQNAGLKTEVSDLKAENEQMKAQIAAMMAKLGM